MTDKDGRRLEVRQGRFAGTNQLNVVVRLEQEGHKRDGRIEESLHLDPDVALQLASALIQAVIETKSTAAVVRRDPPNPPDKIPHPGGRGVSMQRRRLPSF